MSSASRSQVGGRELRGHRDKVTSLKWSPDGRKLGSGSADQTARVWLSERASSTRDSLELRGHSGDISQLAWDPSHTDRLCTASLDKSLKIWDIRTPKAPLQTLLTPGENINVAWASDGQTIAVGSKDDVIIFLDVRSLSSAPQQKVPILKTLKSSVEVNEIGWNVSSNLFFLTTGRGRPFSLS